MGEIITRLEKKGFQFIELKLHHITNPEAQRLYEVHKTKPFYQELLASVTSGPVLMMLLHAPNAVETLRKVIGATNPLTAEPGTIRGDLSVSITANIIHASDSLENAQKEAAIFFPNKQQHR
jgi:nucleoside-diphosphate kinase